ncbi:hypothetical protein [Actinacidiphila rubida]|uniref:Uncharacterized protein n=1 Tax=Actinacidiphila rubida TaxID=310780 RepID=A0A1H8MWB6_9ACTN|nr:hypothetical protein [Actinacidiphila rubida]SEO21574.1 hypothetical protein SAMN05216267_102035 [Actinacidiphila rubida]
MSAERTAGRPGRGVPRGVRAWAGVAVVAAAMTVAVAAPAQAAGGTAGTPFKGRSEGGSLLLKDGDIVACAGVGQLQVAQSDGTIRGTGGAGTTFTTPAGTKVVTVVKGTVKVTVQGVTARVTCGSQGFPTTSAFVPSGSLKGGVDAGSGGSPAGVNTAELAGGGALVASGLLGLAALRRRRATVTVRGDVRTTVRGDV